MPEKYSDRSHAESLAQDALGLAFDGEHDVALGKLRALKGLRGSVKWKRLAAVLPRIRESVKRGLDAFREDGPSDALSRLEAHDRAYSYLLLDAYISLKDGEGALRLLDSLAPREENQVGLWAETARRLLAEKAPPDCALAALDRARALEGDSDEHLLRWAPIEARALEALGRDDDHRALWTRVLRLVEARKPNLRREDEGARIRLAALERQGKRALGA
jgi:hypothetical protein